MKKIKSFVSLLLGVLLVLSLVACSSPVEAPQTAPQTASPSASVQPEAPGKTGLWANARYTEDTTLGNGAKTVTVEVKAEDRSVIFTVKTDQTTVGAALLEHDLIAGEQGAYGLYVKKVNGITADFDVDQSYWGFYINGEMAMTGVDGTEITEGARYLLAYTK